MVLSEDFNKRMRQLSGVEKSTILSESIYLNEISLKDIKIPEKYIKDELNPDIWDDLKLKPEVRSAILKIVREFYKFLDLGIKIKKIRLLGGNANYNWTNKSDIDVHLFFDLSKIDKDQKFIEDFIYDRQSIWKQKHDIKINGYAVELYPQDINSKFYSAGVYDIANNKWEKQPIKQDLEIDKDSLKKKIVLIADQIENLDLDKESSPREIYLKSEKLKEKIKDMRSGGLEKGGEFSIENLAFKYLRNEGYIEKLMNLSNKAFDQDLTLNKNK